jgi:hypothetical protein
LPLPNLMPKADWDTLPGRLNIWAESAVVVQQRRASVDRRGVTGAGPSEGCNRARGVCCWRLWCEGGHAALTPWRSRK